MHFVVSSDTTELSYWLNWSFLLCAIGVLTPLCIAAFLIWKYEDSLHLKSDKDASSRERAWFLYKEEAWRPCLKRIHPLWLLAFRITAFCLIFATFIADVVIHGAGLFHYYTQWTLTLVTIYFAFGSLLSIYGCFQHRKRCRQANLHSMGVDAEGGFYVPLLFGEADNAVKMANNLSLPGKIYVIQTAAFWGFAFHIMFQMTAGAVMLTDGVYWSIIFPLLTLRDYHLNLLTYLAHSLNAVLLLGDTALNCLRFPWFRISYFLLFTGFYVVFEWIFHIFVSIWWPYPFLDLSLPYAPLWYLVVAVLHIPCYGMFLFIVEGKHFLLSRWFPQSYNQCLS